MASRPAFVVCKMPMPAPGAPGAPWFEGKNVTDFLGTFDNMCDNHDIGQNERLKMVC